MGGPASERADGTSETRDKAQEYGEQARDKAQEYGSQAREKAQEYGEQAQQRAEQGKEQAAGGMERAAETLRSRTGDSSGVTAEAGTKAADAMEGAASYLRSHDTTEIWSDVESFAKTHPTQALAGAIVAGFVLGRILR
jgi:ElaB/YqjD/DUF883 family membrane-anchored ribosome-binding protein